MSSTYQEQALGGSDEEALALAGDEELILVTHYIRLIGYRDKVRG